MSNGVECPGCKSLYAEVVVDEEGYCPKCLAAKNDIYRVKKSAKARGKHVETPEKYAQLVENKLTSAEQEERKREQHTKELAEIHQQHEARKERIQAERPAFEARYNTSIRAQAAQQHEETEAQRAAKRILAQRELARRHMLPYVTYTTPNYQAGWFHKDLCRKLEKFSRDVEAGKSPRLMITVPPRHGKSTLGTQKFPAFHLGRCPEHEIITASYSASLANKFSKMVRAIMRSEDHQNIFPGCRLDEDDASVEGWSTTKGGAYFPTGVGGPATGRGAHILVIDDPVKNREEAESETTREAIKDWYTSTAYTRLAPGGGVLIIQCMTGDTPVRMPDNTDRRLDSIRPGDRIATYRNGRKSTARVRAVRSNGRDSIYRITMTSGRVVHANERHPFLVHDHEGLKWVRTRALTSDHKIVASVDSGASGKAKLVQPTIATNPQNAEGCANPITTNGSGQLGTARQAQPGVRDSAQNSNTDTELQRTITTEYSRIRVGYAPYAVSHLSHKEIPTTGKTPCVLTTATTQERSEDSFATNVISRQDTLPLSKWHIPSPSICGFTLDQISSIEPAGEDEVFDLQVEETENFIANGLVSHNTRWHDDDLAGWLRDLSDKDEGDHFEVVDYPAIAEEDEKYRKEGEALHPERYPLDSLLRIKKAIGGRDWNALYQQKPVPDDGDYFTKTDLRWYEEHERPSLDDMAIYAAGDFAIGQKQRNDSTVLYVVGIDRDLRVWVLDRYKGKWGTYGIIKQLCLMYRTWEPEIVGGEEGHIKMSIDPVLQKEKIKPEHNAAGLFLKPLKPGKQDKIARARPIQSMIEAHQVYFPLNAPWIQDMLNEVLRFPSGKHDDDVDTLAWIGQMINLFSPRPIPSEKREKSWRDNLDKFVSKSSGSARRSAMAS